MILSLLGDARERALPYLYLGYWIDGCDKMDYKARFRPLEVHGTGGWTILDAPANGQDISNH
jgi:arginine-tRNA-protein transferase